MNNGDWIKYRKKHQKKLLDEGIKTTRDYVEKFASESLSLEEGDLTEDDLRVLKEMSNRGSDGLRGFSRVYPRENQKVMVIGTNPRLKLSGLRDSDNHKLVAETDMLKREEICIETSYFKTSGTGKKFRRQIAKLYEANIIDELTDSVNTCDVSPESVYFTNFYKFATKNENGIPEWAYKSDSLAIEMLKKEVESINPAVIVSLGKPTWEKVFRDEVEKTDQTSVHMKEHPMDLSIREAAGLTFYDPRYDAPVLPLIHPAGGDVYTPIYRLSEMEASESSVS